MPTLSSWKYWRSALDSRTGSIWPSIFQRHVCCQQVVLYVREEPFLRALDATCIAAVLCKSKHAQLRAGAVSGNRLGAWIASRTFVLQQA